MADTIREYLISLGFNLDQAGAKKFENTIVDAGKKVVAMGLAVETAAATVVAFTTKIAAGLDNLYWAAQRTGSSAQGIQQLGYAFSQVGGTATGAQSAIENLARFMRNSPGAEGFLNRLGVQTRDASGNMRDMSSIFMGVGKQLNNMPYYRANQFAQMLGIDETTLLAMRRGVSQFSTQYTEMAKAIGYNADSAAAGSNRFMTSIGANLATGLAGSIDNLRKQIIDNFPKIEGMVETGAKAMLKAGDILGQVITRAIQAASGIIDWWNSLSSSGKKLTEVIGIIIVGWKALNSAFLMSPLGIITSLAAGILLLYDDYKTWKEGGKSLIDWSKWEPDVEKAMAALGELCDWLAKAIDKVGGIKTVLELLAVYIGVKWIIALTGPIKSVIGLFSTLLSTVNLIPPAISAIPTVLAAAMSAAAIYAIIASINEAYNRMMAIKNGTTYDAIASNSEEMSELDKIKRENWASNNPGVPYPEQKLPSGVSIPKPTTQGSQNLAILSPILSQLESMYQLPAGIMRAVAIAESRGETGAHSGAGAMGMFQFMPDTAAGLGLSPADMLDPVKQASAAAKYIAQLMQQNHGDIAKTLASYNWGIGNVQKYGLGMMPKETRDYIPRVLANMPSDQQPGTNVSNTPTINQQTTINMYGAGGDANATASAIANKQIGVNSQIIQSLPTIR